MSEESQMIDEAYTVSGNSIVISDDNEKVEYCIKGDSLTVRQPVDNGVFIEWHAKRQ